MSDEIFNEMLASFFSPEIQECISFVESVVGCNLSLEERDPFLYFHNFITNPEPSFITRWRADPLLEKWYHRFVNGFLRDVQDTYACVAYHFDNLMEIETNITEGISKLGYKNRIGNSILAMGNTKKWDFEYQAFILACRRCLDFLARGICAYFRNDFHSFRKLGDFFYKKIKSAGIAKPLVSIHAKYTDLFQFVLSKGDRKSLRDKICHYEYVPVGVLNLSERGLVLVGGGEKLNGKNQVILSDVLRVHKNNLQSCIREMIYGLVNVINEVEQCSK